MIIKGILWDSTRPYISFRRFFAHQLSDRNVSSYAKKIIRRSRRHRCFRPIFGRRLLFRQIIHWSVIENNAYIYRWLITGYVNFEGVGSFGSVLSPRGRTRALRTSTHSSIELPGMWHRVTLTSKLFNFAIQPFIDLFGSIFSRFCLIWQLFDSFPFKCFRGLSQPKHVYNSRFLSHSNELSLLMTNFDDFINLVNNEWIDE